MFSWSNGNGTLHPRGFGTCKSMLEFSSGNPPLASPKKPIKEAERITHSLKIKGEVEGKIVNGIVVSVGHKISLKTAVK